MHQRSASRNYTCLGRRLNQMIIMCANGASIRADADRTFFYNMQGPQQMLWCLRMLQERLGAGLLNPRSRPSGSHGTASIAAQLRACPLTGRGYPIRQTRRRPLQASIRYRRFKFG